MMISGPFKLYITFNRNMVFNRSTPSKWFKSMDKYIMTKKKERKLKLYFQSIIKLCKRDNEYQIKFVKLHVILNY